MEIKSKMDLVRENILFNSNRFKEREDSKYIKESPAQLILRLGENLDDESLEILISKCEKKETKPGTLCPYKILVFCKEKKKEETLLMKKEFFLLDKFFEVKNDLKKIHEWINEVVKYIYETLHPFEKGELISIYCNYSYFHELLGRKEFLGKNIS